LFSLINLKNANMKKFRFLLFFIAIMGISTLHSCGGASDKETNKDTTQASSEPKTPEEKPDSTAK
jgi:hypothetical protein